MPLVPSRRQAAPACMLYRQGGWPPVKAAGRSYCQGDRPPMHVHARHVLFHTITRNEPSASRYQAVGCQTSASCCTCKGQHSHVVASLSNAARAKLEVLRSMFQTKARSSQAPAKLL